MKKREGREKKKKGVGMTKEKKLLRREGKKRGVQKEMMRKAMEQQEAGAKMKKGK